MRGVFKESFTSANLDKASFQTIEDQSIHDAVIVHPDADGRVLLQLSQLRTDSSLAMYNDDAKAVCPKTFALF